MTEVAEAPASRSLWWVGIEAVTLSAVSFVVLAALARSLDPEAFGRAATALAIVQIACSVVEALFMDALAQRRDLDEPQRRGAHTLSAGVALAVTLGLVLWGWVGAGSVAYWVALMAPSIACTGLTAVPLAMLRRRLALREAALLMGVARVSAGALAIALLAGGAGVWGLVAHQNLSALLLVVALQARGHAVLTGWGPSAPARPLLRFAFVNTLHGVLTSNRARLFQLGSALVMPARVVGELALALRLVEMLAAVVVTGVARAALVHFSEAAYAGRRIGPEFLTLTRRFAALAIPVFAFVAALGVPLVQLVGDRSWLSAAGLVAAFAIAQALRSPVYLGATLFAAQGRPQLNVFIVAVELASLAVLTLWWRDPMAWLGRLAFTLPLTMWLLQRWADVPALALLLSLIHI